jgi:NAD(P)H dehydrogenase (quinone)
LTIAIIGATGQFGSDIIEALLARGVNTTDILALGRDSGRLEQLAGRGLRTASIDLTDEEGTAATLTGVETLLLISVGGPGEGLAPRTAAVNAAAATGVPHIVYTSALNAPTTTFVLAAEHKATEDVITASGIPATFLRNGWYTDNLGQDFETARTRGVIANSVGDGRLATAPRRDFAEAAAVVLTTPGHEGTAYELSADTAWNYSEFADAAQQVLGTPVRYDALTPEQERDMLLGAGLDEGTVNFIGVLNAGMRDNTQAATSGDLSRLIGRPTTPLIDTLTTWK